MQFNPVRENEEANALNQYKNYYLNKLDSKKDQIDGKPDQQSMQLADEMDEDNVQGQIEEKTRKQSGKESVIEEVQNENPYGKDAVKKESENTMTEEDIRQSEEAVKNS